MYRTVTGTLLAGVTAPHTDIMLFTRLTFGQLMLMLLGGGVDGQVTVIGTGPEVLLPELVSPVALTVAESLITPQLAVVVAAVRVMVRVWPVARVPKLQVKLMPPATGELGWQMLPSAPPTVQDSPLGRTSVRVTLLAVLLLVTFT